MELLNNTADPMLHGGGGYADVYKYMDNGLEVAIKVVRFYATADLRKVTRVSHVDLLLLCHCAYHRLCRGSTRRP